jgi:DNA-binding response OmpR family regulator
MSTILVMDDDEQVRAMLRQALEREGYEVLDAPDGKEGMRLFREQGADLIITDLIMPEKEGLETIMELRRDFPDVKIIAISGGGRVSADEYLDQAYKFGARVILTKPFALEELLDAVRELLE